MSGSDSAEHLTRLRKEDYSKYSEGDVFPPLKKRIHALVLSDHNYTVFLDETLEIEWALTDDYGELCAGSAGVLTRVSALQGLPIVSLNPFVVRNFRLLVAESVACVLEHRDVVAAKEALDAALDYYKVQVAAAAEESRARSFARAWYLSASVAVLAFVSIGALTAWGFRDSLERLLGTTVLSMVLASAAGALGSFVSVVGRSPSLVLDPAAGKWIHVLDGALRILIGAAAGVIMVLAIRGGFIAAFARSTGSAASLELLFCAAAGASERLVPGLLERVERAAQGSVSGQPGSAHPKRKSK